MSRLKPPRSEERRHQAVEKALTLAARGQNFCGDALLLEIVTGGGCCWRGEDAVDGGPSGRGLLSLTVVCLIVSMDLGAIRA